MTLQNLAINPRLHQTIHASSSYHRVFHERNANPHSHARTWITNMANTQRRGVVHVPERAWKEFIKSGLGCCEPNFTCSVLIEMNHVWPISNLPKYVFVLFPPLFSRKRTRVPTFRQCWTRCSFRLAESVGSAPQRSITQATLLFEWDPRESRKKNRPIRLYHCFKC